MLNNLFEKAPEGGIWNIAIFSRAGSLDQHKSCLSSIKYEGRGSNIQNSSKPRGMLADQNL